MSPETLRQAARAVALRHYVSANVHVGKQGRSTPSDDLDRARQRFIPAHLVTNPTVRSV